MIFLQNLLSTKKQVLTIKIIKMRQSKYFPLAIQQFQFTQFYHSENVNIKWGKYLPCKKGLLDYMLVHRIDENSHRHSYLIYQNISPSLQLKNQKQFNMFKSCKTIFNPLFSSSKTYMDLQTQYGCHNYHPLQVVIQRASRIYMWDCEGKRYFDFLSAYSAVNQGHCHPRILEAFIEQSKNLTLTSRAVYNNKLGLIQKKLHDIFGYDKVLMMNSGVEAGQSSVKFARRWGYEVKKVQPNKASVLFAKGNFWGRTIAACGSSDDPDRYRNFGPFDGLNFNLIEYGCTKSLQEALKANPNIVAFMVEPIQGQKGVIVPPEGYLKKCKQLLEKYNALLICDEIQTGLGRTGKLLCSDYDGVKPDMVLLGKALSGGFLPVSAVLADDKIMKLIKPGEHGSTYGGNPLACQTAITALDVLLEEKMCENAAKLGQIFKKGLTEIMNKQKVKEIRGKGLFIGVQFNSDKIAHDFSYAMLRNGVIAKPTQKHTIRFAPPLVITQPELEEALSLIQKSWKQVV